MLPTRALLTCLAAVSLTAVTCNNNGKAEEGSAKVGSAATPSTPAAPGADSAVGGSGAAPAPGPGSAAGAEAGGEDYKRALTGIPGMDFSSLPDSAQRQLAQVLTDEFCHCGCPHTIGQCLRTHTSCRHAKRMIQIAAPDAKAGADSASIINEMKKYYVSYTEPRANNLKPDDRMCHGPKDAKITMVEFADFECPWCGAARPKLEAFEQTAQGKSVRVCYLPFPLNAHPNAIPAGQAALYARDHGKFWQMHDALFENQFNLSPQFIRELAEKIGLSGAELQKVFAEKKYVDELMGYREMGKAANVESTPTLYVNGRKFALPIEPDLLQLTVDDELEWTGNKNAWAAD